MSDFISGGVCAPQGFTANGVLNKIKESRTTFDTALIFSEKVCNVAGVFTQNRVKAECVKLTKENIKNGRAQAVIANSGNANCCTGNEGFENAKKETACVAEILKIDANDVLVCSTGVIGQQLPVEKILNGMDSLVSGLSKDGNEKARAAIMTTDTKFKECAVETEISGKKVRLGTMAKGSGMIHINLGTMLAFITTDCAITPEMLEKAIRKSVAGTYNCVSVDGDTSTNDTMLILANGMAGNSEITGEGEDFEKFVSALDDLNTEMAKKIAADGEGAGRLVTCNIHGASSVEIARGLAKSVISSNLVKAAFFGRDANWGRILCAMGYSGFDFTPEKTNVSFVSNAGEIEVFHQGVPLNFDEDKAKKILSETEVTIEVNCDDGNADGTAWGCDLTYDYVKINGDYRT